MHSEVIEEIIRCMGSSGESASAKIQRVQTKHRMKLAEFWGIKNAQRILEIGCGQGDTTAVLAYMVGENGMVHGVDIASPDYGSPVSVGEAAAVLMQSSLGKRIKMEYEVDALSPEVMFPANSFDAVVLSHCSWYFSSFEELHALLKKTRKWAKKLYFAEWDCRITMAEQLPHFLAVLIQAQYECFKRNSSANVRTLMTPNDIKKIAERAGWNVIQESSIQSIDMQDGKWEVEATVSDYQSELHEISGMPTKLKTLVQSEVDLLQEVSNNVNVKPLSTFAMIAE